MNPTLESIQPSFRSSNQPIPSKRADPGQNPRLGFHYFPDTLHYRESDLHTWLPELKALGTAWLTLVAPSDRAIPEDFLRGLLEAEIQPILHFSLPLDHPPRADNLQLLLSSYASWGVKYVALFDRPNTRAAWPATTWAQSDLVERFLDIYLPLAEASLQSGLIPVFPPLEPGGDYWDTAFLRAALQGMKRRGHSRLLNNLVFGAYAISGDHHLDWGAGGPERWPGARPYYTPKEQEDQRGFYIFDWYLTLIQAELREPRPILLFGIGASPKPDLGSSPSRINESTHTQKNLSIFHLITGEEESPALPPLHPKVLACNFWIMAASPEDSNQEQAWFRADGSTLPIVGILRQWFSESRGYPSYEGIQLSDNQAQEPADTGTQPIAHYLLLPTYEWGVAEWHLDVIRPFVKKYRPTVGFSLEEATLAARVTVVGGEQAFSEETLQRLEKAGCFVERISGDGTSIATQLATR